MNLIFGDCLKMMEKMADQSIDLILADPPYGVTRAKWDCLIPCRSYVEIKNKIFYEQEFIFEKMKDGMKFNEAEILFTMLSKPGLWDHLSRIIKPNGAILLFGVEPFSSFLRNSNLEMYRYDWIWEKTEAKGHLNAKKRPLSAHEVVSVFYHSPPLYNPQKTMGHERKVSKNKDNSKNQSELYNSQIGISDYDSTERYPRSVILFKTDKQKNNIYPTQKPVALLEYFIKTYTHPKDRVLDFSMGSGSTGEACFYTDRFFIGIEKEREAFEKATSRLEKLVWP